VTPTWCPRCDSQYIPCNEYAGQYGGALSRADNLTEVCSECGLDEAVCSLNRKDIAGVDQWPVTLYSTPLRAADIPIN